MAVLKPEGGAATVLSSEVIVSEIIRVGSAPFRSNGGLSLNEARDRCLDHLDLLNSCYPNWFKSSDSRHTVVAVLSRLDDETARLRG